MPTPRLLVSASLALALTAALAVDARAQQRFGYLVPSGTQSVPSNGSPGTGLIRVDVDVPALTVSIDGSFSGLLGNVTVAHLHQAPPGSNGGVILPLFPTGTTSGTVSGASGLGAAQIAAIVGGGTYVNIHSTVLPGGEIRADVEVPFEVWSPGSPCATGAVPTILPIGVFEGGSANSLDLAGAPSSAPTYLVIGLTSLRAGFKGGTLGPNPDILIGPLPTSPSGTLAIPYVLPAVPAGLSLWLQFWIQDPGTPSGFCSTDTVKGTTT